MDETYYVIERFGEQLKTVKSAMEAMPLKRKAVDAYRAKNNLEKAKDVYEELKALKGKLLDAVLNLRLLFAESEMPKEAEFCGKLHGSVKAFNLMTPDYGKLIKALEMLMTAVPQSETANAKVIGRLMNNVRMGYYPTDLEHVGMIKKALIFPGGRVNVLDPCCGCGQALERLTQDENAETYGAEIDESRAADAETRLDRVAYGSFFYSRMSHEAFHALFLNPPYLSVMSEGGLKTRGEKRFLVESLYHLMQGGVLIYIVPYYRLTKDICRIICDNFEQISLYRFMDKEFSRFHQIVLFGVRKKKEDGSEAAERLSLYASDPERIPLIDTLPEGKYVLPAKEKKVDLFKGAVFNLGELERQLRQWGVEPRAPCGVYFPVCGVKEPLGIRQYSEEPFPCLRKNILPHGPKEFKASKIFLRQGKKRRNNLFIPSIFDAACGEFCRFKPSRGLTSHCLCVQSPLTRSLKKARLTPWKSDPFSR